jgi:addiction module HigA family antidote
MPMKNPPHPGGFVLRQCIEPLGLTIKDAAAALGVTRTTLSELVNGRRGISPEMAVRLSKVFGGSAESWLTQQAHYDIAQVRADRIKLKSLCGSSVLDLQALKRLLILQALCRGRWFGFAHHGSHDPQRFSSYHTDSEAAANRVSVRNCTLPIAFGGATRSRTSLRRHTRISFDVIPFGVILPSENSPPLRGCRLSS